jgi:hypothetical protein
MPSINLTSTEILWIVAAVLGLVVILAILRFVLSLALGLIRTIFFIGLALILSYSLYLLFLR